MDLGPNFREKVGVRENLLKELNLIVRNSEMQDVNSGWRMRVLHLNSSYLNLFNLYNELISPELNLAELFGPEINLSKLMVAVSWTYGSPYIGPELIWNLNISELIFLWNKWIKGVENRAKLLICVWGYGS